MSVIDTSAVVDLLLGSASGSVIADLLAEGPAAAPELLVFETLAVLRRDVARGALDPGRARGAVEDLGDVPIDLFPLRPLRVRAWELRENLTIADGMFVALAEQLDEPLITLDGRLARATAEHSRAEARVP